MICLSKAGPRRPKPHKGCTHENTTYVGSKSLFRGGGQEAIDFCEDCKKHFVRSTGEVFRE